MSLNVLVNLTKQSPSSRVYYMEFYRNIVIENSFIGNVKRKFIKQPLNMTQNFRNRRYV